MMAKPQRTTPGTGRVHVRASLLLGLLGAALLVATPAAAQTYTIAAGAFRLTATDTVWKEVYPPQNPAAELELVHAKGTAFAVVLYDRIEVAFDDLKMVALMNLHQAANAVRLEHEESARLSSGMRVWRFTAKAVVGTTPVQYYGEYYTNGQEIVGVITYTLPQLFSFFRSDLDRLLDGLAPGS